MIDPDDRAVAMANACYPEGVPDQFPIALFAPVPTPLGNPNAMVHRDGLLRERIEDLEEVMFDLPQTELPLDHYFGADGVYCRQMFIPKGTLAIGKVHLTGHLNMLVVGDLTLLTVDGPVRIKAPFTFSSAAGTKKVVMANEDCLFVTLHATRETDVPTLEKTLAVDRFKDYDAYLAELPGVTVTHLEDLS